jgi:hypothetical protein
LEENSGGREIKSEPESSGLSFVQRHPDIEKARGFIQLDYEGIGDARKQSPTNELPWHSECMFTEILDGPMIDLVMSIIWKSPSIKRG